MVFVLTLCLPASHLVLGAATPLEIANLCIFVNQAHSRPVLFQCVSVAAVLVLTCAGFLLFVCLCQRQPVSPRLLRGLLSSSRESLCDYIWLLSSIICRSCMCLSEVLSIFHPLGVSDSVTQRTCAQVYVVPATPDRL